MDRMVLLAMMTFNVSAIKTSKDCYVMNVVTTFTLFHPVIPANVIQMDPSALAAVRMVPVRVNMDTMGQNAMIALMDTTRHSQENATQVRKRF